MELLSFAGITDGMIEIFVELQLAVVCSTCVCHSITEFGTHLPNDEATQRTDQGSDPEWSLQLVG